MTITRPFGKLKFYKIGIGMVEPPGLDAAPDWDSFASFMEKTSLIHQMIYRKKVELYQTIFPFHARPRPLSRDEIEEMIKWLEDIGLYTNGRPTGRKVRCVSELILGWPVCPDFYFENADECALFKLRWS